mmetsp:Transcript_4184/g.13758  ORF Transcript_4184/g.13758 Transcript_4184/m.13758 type:complete len:293 (-) Transcript_4184:2163-3041(-)
MSTVMLSRLRDLAKVAKNWGETSLQPETLMEEMTWKEEETSAWMASSLRLTHLATSKWRRAGAKMVILSSLFMLASWTREMRRPSRSTCFVRQLSTTTRSMASWPTARTSPKAFAFFRRSDRTTGHTARSFARDVAANLGASTMRRSSRTPRASPSTETCRRPWPPSSKTRKVGGCATVDAAVVPVKVSSLTALAGTSFRCFKDAGTLSLLGPPDFKTSKFDISSFRRLGIELKASLRIPAKAAVADFSSSSSKTISRVVGPNRSHRSTSALRDGVHAYAVSTRTICNSRTK